MGVCVCVYVCACACVYVYVYVYVYVCICVCMCVCARSRVRACVCQRQRQPDKDRLSKRKTRQNNAVRASRLGMHALPITAVPSPTQAAGWWQVLRSEAWANRCGLRR